MCMHARMRRLVWSEDGTYVDATMAGARQNMRVCIPSCYYTTLLSSLPLYCIHDMSTSDNYYQHAARVFHTCKWLLRLIARLQISINRAYAHARSNAGVQFP